MGVGAAIALAGAESSFGASALGGASLGAISGALFRAAGARPAGLVGLAAFLGPAASAGTLLAASEGPPLLAQAAALLATGAVAVPVAAMLLTRGNLFNERSLRWFAPPHRIAFAHSIGRPLVPHDLRKLEPYSGDRREVLEVRHHPCPCGDDFAVISIVSRRRRAHGILARLLPFVGLGELVLPPTAIRNADLELLRQHPGRLDGMH